MTAPNLVGDVSLNLQRSLAVLGTASTSVVSCPDSASQRITRLVVANDSTLDGTVSVSLRRGGTDYSIFKSLDVKSKSTGELLGQDAALYLEYGDAVVASASQPTSCICCYEQIALPLGDFLTTQSGEPITTETGDMLVYQ